MVKSPRMPSVSEVPQEAASREGAAPAPGPARAHVSSRTGNYLTGLLTGYGVIALMLASNLFLTSFSLRFLDKEEYGIFVFSSDILAWLTLLDLGMSSGLRLQVSRLPGRRHAGRVNRLASTNFFTQLALSSLIILAAGLAAVFAPAFFNVRPDLRGAAAAVLLVMALGAAIDFVKQPLTSLLVARQQIHVGNVIRLVQVLARTALAVLFLLLGWGLLALAAAAVVSSGLAALLTFLRCRSSMPWLSIGLNRFSWPLLWRDLKGLNIWLAISAAAGSVTTGMDRILAASLISFESVTTLALTDRVYLLASLLLSQLLFTAQPGLGEIVGTGDASKSFATYRRVFLLTNGLALVVGLSLWSGNAAFVTSWVGANNYGGRWLDSVLLLALLTTTWTVSSRMILNAALRVRRHTQVRVAEALLNVCLSIILGSRYGLAGIVAATVLAAVVMSGWYVLLLVADYFGRGFWSLLRELAGPLFKPALILLPLAAGMRLCASASPGYAGAILASGVVCVCGFGLLWLFVFDAEMRRRVGSGGRQVAAFVGLHRRADIEGGESV